MKNSIIYGILAVIVAIVGFAWTVILILDRALDGVPHSAIKIVAPAVIGLVASFVIQGLVVRAFAKRMER